MQQAVENKPTSEHKWTIGRQVSCPSLNASISFRFDVLWIECPLSRTIVMKTGARESLPVIVIVIAFTVFHNSDAILVIKNF